MSDEKQALYELTERRADADFVREVLGISNRTALGG
jgi:hypothetical protein